MSNLSLAEIDESKALRIAKVKTLQSSLFFTRYFFKHRQRRKFAIEKHHKLITDALDRVYKGEITKLIINIAPRYGKAIDCNTQMLTPNGWVKASEIESGDYLFGRDGKPTKVLATYPQGVTDAYRVTFSDNTSLVTCSEHLWSLNHKDLSRKDKFTFKEVRKTGELIGNLNANDGHKLWHIPTCESLDLPYSELPIDPYLFGCWLGDGSSYKAEITTMDDDIINKFSSYGVTVRTTQNSGQATTYGIRGKFITKLKSLNVVGDKHIPIQYLLASHEQRLELLRGLCDTDGTCNRKNGQVSVCSTSRKLINGIKSLICSLGGFYTVYRDSIFFRLTDCPFHLERKKANWKPLTNKHFTKRFIKSIEKVDDRETVCFTVDAEDHLFLAGEDLIVTHNTEIAVKNFIANGLALNPASKFIHLSYADDLALDNSEEVRDIVTSEEYQTLFPEVQIKVSSKAKDKWYTTAGGGVLARAAGGQVTGFGAGRVDDEDVEFDEFINEIDQKQKLFAGAIVIDDPIKPDDADSEIVRNRINNRYDSTIKNRVNSRKTPIVIIMQRLHENDLCGYLLEQEPGEWEVLSIPCIQEDEEGNEYALWPLKHTLEELYRLRELNPIMFSRQYMQNPMPKEGFLYSTFKTYKFYPEPLIPATKTRYIKAYTDTADEGKDYLCSIAYIETEIGLYVIDVIYTQDSMEVTEPLTAQFMTKNNVQTSVIESNNGGRGFSRAVESQTRILKNHKTQFVWFHQSQNKQARIFTRSAEVTNMIYMPEGWDKRWPKFHKAVTQYVAIGKNTNDDAPDVLTSLVERIGQNMGSGWGKYV